MLSEKFIWKLIENYVDKKGIISHQIDSFNDFIYFGIKKVILSESPLVIIPEKKLYTLYSKYSVYFSNIYIPTPKLMSDNRKQSKLYPNHARNSNLTYDSPIYVDITEKIEFIDKDPIIQYTKKVIIGRVPIMLRSMKCNLSNLTREERIKVQECEYDNGGYFIYKGKERVLISQLRNNYNIPIVLKTKNDEFICDVRSMSESTGHSTSIKITVKNNNVFCNVPYINSKIEIGVLLCAMGFTQLNNLQSYLNISDTRIDKICRNILKKSYNVNVNDGGQDFFNNTNQDTDIIWEDLSEDQKLDWENRAIKHNALKLISKDLLLYQKEQESIDYTRQVVENELLPHLGIMATTTEKINFILYMLQKTLNTFLGKRQVDDRDNYINKRVESPGILCYELFKKIFKNWVNVVTLLLNKKKQIPHIMTIIPRINDITKGFGRCFATGIWGIHSNAYVRVGVVQILSRLSYGATLSNLRRINIPMGKDSKFITIRQINPSQIMFICPVETPEGQSVGVVLNLSFLTIISKKSNKILVQEILNKSEYLITDTIHYDKTKVLLNGTIIGYTDHKELFQQEFKKFRKIRLIPHEVSINYYDIDDEILIFSDEGRLLRPVFSVENNKLLMKESDGIDWDTLIEKGLITYVDNNEVNNSVIAFNQKDLDLYKSDFCEISPTMMMGVMGSIIPFPDHSQSPRNCYQSSMGKQAISNFALSYKNRTDTIVHVLETSQKPLVSTKPAEFMGFNYMTSGINCIVAIACYTGFNQEDSIIMNYSAIQRGLFHITSYRTHVESEIKNGSSTQQFCIPDQEYQKQNYNYGYLDENGIVKKRLLNKNIFVKEGDVIIGKITVKKNKDVVTEIEDTSLTIKKGEEGFIDNIFISKDNTGNKIVKIKIRKIKIPEVGDKFASRAAQKGICGMVYTQEDMPFTQDGITPDIIINPHCIPSRMTINQLMETVLGKYSSLSGTFGDATPFSENNENIAEKICKKLFGQNFCPNGNEVLYNGMSGEPMGQYFIGPVYYQRLKHIVSDKIHARATGPITTLTRQPLEGRSREGGLRFGEMERDCMISHGTSAFLKERLFYQSDPFTVSICRKCNNFSNTKTECKSCEVDDIVETNIPYTSKLLLQELNAMGIKTKIEVN